MINFDGWVLLLWIVLLFLVGEMAYMIYRNLRQSRLLQKQSLAIYSARVERAHTLSAGIWEEGKDISFANWKRCRNIIEQENLLINNRLLWLFTTHGFLITMVGLLLNTELDEKMHHTILTHRVSIHYLLYGVTFIGMTLCSFIYVGTSHAQDQMNATHNWWQLVVDDRFRHPPLEFNPPGFGFGPFSNSKTPVLFFCGWVGFLVFDHYIRWGKFSTTCLTSKEDLLQAIGIVFLAVASFGSRRIPILRNHDDTP